MSLPLGTNRVVQGLAVLTALIGALLLDVTGAAAGIGGSDTPTWPSTATVGDIINTSVLITNSSTAPNNTESVNLTTLFVTPACADGVTSICLAGNEDPGIFKVLATAVGDPSTLPCANVTFTVGSPNPITGEVALTPTSTVTLGPVTGGVNLSCQVNLQLRVFAVPTNPAPGPPVTTNPLTRATLVGASSGLGGTASGSAQIRISKGTVTLTTTSNPSATTVPLGTSVTDTAVVTKAPGATPPTGSVRFILCQPNQVTAAGCPAGTGTTVPVDKPLIGGSATSDPTNNTNAVGKYCWRARYLGDDNYEAQNHTNATTECFTTTAGTPIVTTLSSPTGGGVTPGTSVSDAVTVSGGAGQPTPTGTVTFFLCQPNQVTASGCVSPAGSQVGIVKTLDANGQATSDTSMTTNTIGKYCWRAEYSGDGTYSPVSHTDPSAECFTTTEVTAELCKTPGFFGNHVTITQLALEAAIAKVGGSSITICGEPIDNTNVLDEQSAIEAICVRPSTDKDNPLHGGRNLMVTALNCAVTNPSGGPTTVCDGTSVGDLFEACNTACAAERGLGSQFSVTINNQVIDCNTALDCYNNGKLFNPASNQCTDSAGACNHDTSVFGTCSGSGALCSDNTACPQGEQCQEGSADPTSCKAARNNDCTIFGGC